jgi:hypothetical protein
MRPSLLTRTAGVILLLGACSASPTESVRSAVPALRADGGGLAGSGSFAPVTTGTAETGSAATQGVATDSTARGGPLAGSGS